MMIDITKVIDGRRYSTSTATEICQLETGCFQSDFRYEETALYQTANGRFFIAGHGGPLSRWSQRYGNDTRGGSGLNPVTPIEARAFAESYASAETITKFFEIEEA